MRFLQVPGLHAKSLQFCSRSQGINKGFGARSAFGIGDQGTVDGIPETMPDGSRVDSIDLGSANRKFETILLLVMLQVE